MGRGDTLAERFSSDKAFARDVADVAEAVDSADLPSVPGQRFLAALHNGSLEMTELAGRTALGESELREGLKRLGDLGLISVTGTDHRTTVALTAAGQLAADRQLDKS